MNCQWSLRAKFFGFHSVSICLLWRFSLLLPTVSQLLVWGRLWCFRLDWDLLSFSEVLRNLSWLSGSPIFPKAWIVKFTTANTALTHISPNMTVYLNTTNLHVSFSYTKQANDIYQKYPERLSRPMYPKGNIQNNDNIQYTSIFIPLIYMAV